MLDLARARKYAHSLFEAAKAENQLLACHQGLQAFVSAVRRYPPLREVLLHPAVSNEERGTIIASALSEFGTPLLNRFFSLLVRRRRLGLLPAIEQEFQSEMDRMNKVQSLRVRSAYPLSERDSDALRLRLESWLEGKVRMQTLVDPELIAGLVIEAEDYVIDQSFKGQLARLRRQLAG